jgi:predicted tellurium resistance membrane protein TerC
LLAAVATRILLLFSLFWLSHLETPVNLFGFVVTPREIVFGVGGAFLLLKALSELTTVLFGPGGVVHARIKPSEHAFFWVMAQIAFFDIIFSLDSVTAAIGLAQHVEIMVAAVLVATLVMVVLVNPISEFIERHPMVKVAALNLLVLIGAFLLAEAFHYSLPRAELYVALILVLVLQAIVMWVRGLPRLLRYGLVIGGTLSLAVFAVMLINDPALAQAVHERMLGVWGTGTKAMEQALDATGKVLPKH